MAMAKTLVQWALSHLQDKYPILVKALIDSRASKKGTAFETLKACKRVAIERVRAWAQGALDDSMSQHCRLAGARAQAAAVVCLLRIGAARREPWPPPLCNMVLAAMGFGAPPR